MKLILSIILTIAAISIVKADDDAGRSIIRFTSYHSGSDLFQFSLLDNIPIRLLKKIVAAQLGSQMKDVFLYTSEDVALKDAYSLSAYNLGSDPSIKVITAKETTFDFVDLETEQLLAQVAIEATSSFGEVKLILDTIRAFQGKRVTLYFGQQELKDDQKVCTSGLHQGDKILVYLENFN